MMWIIFFQATFAEEDGSTQEIAMAKIVVTMLNGSFMKTQIKSTSLLIQFTQTDGQALESLMRLKR